MAGQWLRLSLHNAYLDILYAMGLLGLAPFVTAIAAGIWQMFVGARQTQSPDSKFCLSLLLILAYLAFFISLNAEMTYAQSGTIMWIFLGMVPMLSKQLIESRVPCPRAE